MLLIGIGVKTTNCNPVNIDMLDCSTLLNVFLDHHPRPLFRLFFILSNTEQKLYIWIQIARV